MDEAGEGWEGGGGDGADDMAPAAPSPRRFGDDAVAGEGQ